MTVGREKMRYEKLDSRDEIIENSKDDIHNLTDPPEMNLPNQDQGRNVFTETEDQHKQTTLDAERTTPAVKLQKVKLRAQSAGINTQVKQRIQQNKRLIQSNI